MKNSMLFISFILLGICTIALNGCKNDDNDMDMTVEDVDGNVYNTVKIGSQVWMTSNLRTTRYNDGSEIPLETSNSFWNDSTTPAYCWYDNDEALNGGEFGALYNYYAVETAKLCPTGWHVPTKADWTTLEEFLGGADVAGGKMKEPGKENWLHDNSIGQDMYGFTALPTGWREPEEGLFKDKGKIGGWWISGTLYLTKAESRYISYDGYVLYSGIGDKSIGICVRCLQD